MSAARRISIATLATAVCISIAALHSPALAEDNTNGLVAAGRQVCANQGSYSGKTQEAISNECQQAKMAASAQKVHTLEAFLYGSVFTVCTAECVAGKMSGGLFGSGKICSTMGIAVSAVDIVNTIRMGGDAQSMVGMMGSALMNVNSFKNAMKDGSEKAKDGAEKTGEVLSGGGKGWGDTLVCFVQAGMAGFQAWAHSSSINGAIEKQRSHYAAAAQQAGAVEQTVIGGSSDPGNSNGAGSNGGGLLGDGSYKRSGDSAEIPTGNNIVQAAASAGFEPLLNGFQKVTGNSPANYYDGIANGVPALDLAAQMSAGSGEVGSNIAAIASAVKENGVKLAAKHKTDPVSSGDKISGFAFEQSSSGRSIASSEPAMPDFAAMMGALMPGSEEQKRPQGAGKALSLSLTQKVDNQGYHPPARSLFEIVDARYQILAPKFTAGEAVTTGRMPSAIPVNPYLGSGK